MSSIYTSNPVTTLDDLLSYDDEHFIHSAYQILLGRVPDLEGMQHYLECVRAGTSKVEIISQLQLSVEGKSRGVKFDLSSPHVGSAASSLEELITYFDKHFVHSAYQTLLGRAPDAEGMRHYLAKVRAGISKIQILTELHESAEGKLRSISIRELKKVIQRHQLLRTPVLGGFLKLFGVGRTEGDTDRSLRAIENNLYALDGDQRCRFAEMNLSSSQFQLLTERTTQIIAQIQQGLADVSLTLTQLQQSLAPDQSRPLETKRVAAVLETEAPLLSSAPELKPHDPIGDRFRGALTEMASRLRKVR